MRGLTFVATLIMVVLLAACGDKVSAPTPASVAGTWRLQTVNGSGLPYVLMQSAAGKAELISDVITAAADGTFSRVALTRFTVNGKSETGAESDVGTFTLNGPSISFLFDSDKSTASGTVAGNSMTLNRVGMSLKYGK